MVYTSHTTLGIPTILPHPVVYYVLHSVYSAASNRALGSGKGETPGWERFPELKVLKVLTLVCLCAQDCSALPGTKNG